MIITKRKKTKEFTIDTDVENVLVCSNGCIFYTLKRVYDIFKHNCENEIMLQPLGTMFSLDENWEDKLIEITFRYEYSKGSEDKVEKTVLKTTIPYRAESNWHIQQTFMMMERMYVLKLNTQILTKHK
jgi:hypothetical protein